MSEPRQESALGRWIKRVFHSLFVLALVLGGAIAYITYPTWKSYPAVSYPPADSLAEKNRQDLDYLAHLPEIDRSFSKEKRRSFERALERAVTRSDNLDKAQFALEVSRLTAIAENSHTNVLDELGESTFASVPIRMAFFGDGLFVVKAQGDSRDLIGAQLVAVNGYPVDAILNAFRPYFGGPQTLLRQHLPRLIVLPELLAALGLNAQADNCQYSFRLASGAIADRLLTASVASAATGAAAAWPVRDLSPIEARTEASDWSHALDIAPLYLSRLNDNYWRAPVDEGRVLFVQINQLRDQGRQKLVNFLAETADQVRRKKIKYVAVDLRFNQGGDYTQAVEFSRRLVEAIPSDGRIFILTSGSTFSGAIALVSRLRYFSGARAVQIGEAIGDHGRFWSEGGKIVLPNSKIAVSYATAYHDWENGCALAEFTTCFLYDYLYGAAAGPMTPHVTVVPQFAYYASGRDMVMDEVAKIVRSAAVVSTLAPAAN